ncbi:Zn-ribbon domain-containing OB-fold protein [Candidatus Bathycorpusculum sp.]|uniref:Zn-ribbon domain-containing OB-fold protein n=1 Tax=Candidatus Bathycorpusculum sp. TaxID=2994959 RepID=UPI002820833F|nr:Zn-ribbon domain-containing OB-fold protein [Candidatus Termitimicrobium sp.]MCL2686114.1 Zn-ribbon domain-containing OB-fold protein [Candidatus Termitimicrobium sp.]
MSTESFTIEQFYKFLSTNQLMAGKCTKCGKIHLPPRPLCSECFSKEFTWTPISGKGKLLTYTIIHVAPTQFQAQTPYAVGIVELEEDLKIPGMIQDIAQEQLKIGMELTLAFDTAELTQNWPTWPRYHFISPKP